MFQRAFQVVGSIPRGARSRIALSSNKPTFLSQRKGCVTSSARGRPRRALLSRTPLTTRCDDTADLREVFINSDTDADGRIDVQEMTSALLSLDLPVQPENMQRLFDMFDPSNSGRLDFETFVSLHREMKISLLSKYKNRSLVYEIFLAALGVFVMVLTTAEWIFPDDTHIKALSAVDGTMRAVLVKMDSLICGAFGLEFIKRHLLPGGSMWVKHERHSGRWALGVAVDFLSCLPRCVAGRLTLLFRILHTLRVSRLIQEIRLLRAASLGVPKGNATAAVYVAPSPPAPAVVTTTPSATASPTSETAAPAENAAPAVHLGWTSLAALSLLVALFF